MKITQLIRTGTLALVAVLSGLCVNAQSSRNVTIKSFSSIGVSSGIDLYLTQGTSESLTIKGENDLIKDVVIEQNGANLSIKFKEGINWGKLFKNQSIKVYVNFKTLKAIAASGGSDVFTQNTIQTDVLNIAASGGADLTLTLNCKDLQVAISGGADLSLKGSGENMIVTASGGADVDAFGFTANYARVTASGGADVNINVVKGIEAGASGGADISYKGSGVLKKTNSSKSGDVRHVN